MSNTVRMPLSDSHCNAITGKSLFYPSCGKDIYDPIKLYMAFVTDFWFVDVSEQCQSIPRETRELLQSLGYEQKKHIALKELHGTTIHKQEPYVIKVKTFTYTNGDESSAVHVHRCCGKGYNALRSIFDENSYTLGVFYYRGDSPGECGSGFYWLGSKTFPHVLRRLGNGGHVVTDGSNTFDGSFLKKRLAKFHNQRDMDPQEAMTQSAGFTYAHCRFQCIGHAGIKRGPVLVWKIDKLTGSV